MRQAVHAVAAKYDASQIRIANTVYYSFSGREINSILLGKANVYFWLEDLGSDRCVLYVTAIHETTNEYVPALRYLSILQKVKNDMNAVEVECIEISNRLFISEQYTKVFKLSDELQALYDDLTRLESQSPNATEQINQMKSTIRLKKTQLDKENNVLEQLTRHSSDL